MNPGRHLLAMLLLLALAETACGAPNNAVELESSTVPTSSPATDLPPTEDKDELIIAPIDEASFWNHSSLDSYRAEYIVTFDGFAEGEGVQGFMGYLIEETSNQPAQHYLFEFEGYDLDDTSLMISELYATDDRIYAKLGIEEDWLSFPGASFDDFRGFVVLPLDIFDLVTNGPRYLDPEPVNGVMCWHYMFGQTTSQVSSIAEAYFKSDIWNAVDGGYVVKIDNIYEGTFSEELKGSSLEIEGTIQFIFNLWDVNQEFALVLPPAAAQAADFSLDCLSRGMEWSQEFIALPDDVAIGFADHATVTACTALSIEEARDFMLEELQGKGWVLDAEPRQDIDIFSGIFYKGGEILSLSIGSIEGVEDLTRIFLDLR